MKDRKKEKHYVILGNGAAAAGCIEGIRAADKKGKITVVSAEKHPVYCRPLISYYLQGKTKRENLGYRPADFYETNNTQVLYGIRAEKIDPGKKAALLDNGETLCYDALCVATGSSPFLPPTPGYESVEKKFTFLTLDDALAIEAALSPTARVLIVGAGLIGLKCAEGIRARVKSVTVCDLAPRVLSSILDEEASEMVAARLKENGIVLHLGTTAARFSPHSAVLQSGEAVPFDLLIMAVGVRPNTALVKEAGGAVGRGITIDAFAKTSLADIYAAGDCTESLDISAGNVKVMALLPNAYLQGHAAGVNMAGGTERFDCAVPMNAIGFFGLHTMTAGCKNEADVYIEKSADALKKLYCKDNHLIGFELVGKTDHAGIYTDLIRKRLPLDALDFESIKKSPNFFAFDANYRRNRLESVV